MPPRYVPLWPKAGLKNIAAIQNTSAGYAVSRFYESAKKEGGELTWYTA